MKRDSDTVAVESARSDTEERRSESRSTTATAVDRDGTGFTRSLGRDGFLTAGLLAVAIGAAAAGVWYPDARVPLFALAATARFGGLFLYALRAERTVSTSVAVGIYEATAANGAAILEELDAGEARLYIPSADGTGAPSSALLFVPVDRNVDLPADLWPTIQPNHGGVVFEPTGAGLFDRFDRLLTTEPSSDPDTLAIQLTDGLVEGLELAGEARPTVDETQCLASVAIAAASIDRVDRFDHPIASFLAVGFAVGLNRPVAVEVEPRGGRVGWVVTCRWTDHGGVPSTVIPSRSNT